MRRSLDDILSTPVAFFYTDALNLLLHKIGGNRFKSKLFMDVHIVFDGTDTRMFFIGWNIWLSDIFGYINKEAK